MIIMSVSQKFCAVLNCFPIFPYECPVFQNWNYLYLFTDRYFETKAVWGILFLRLSQYDGVFRSAFLPCWWSSFLGWYQAGMDLFHAILVLCLFSWMAVCSPVCCHLTVSLHSSSWLGIFFDDIVFDNIFQDIFDTCRDKELLGTDILVLFLLDFCMCTFLL